MVLLLHPSLLNLPECLSFSSSFIIKASRKRFSLFNHFKWSKSNSRLILSISLPLIFQLAISIISWEFFYILIEHHGQQALAVSNVMRNIFGMVGCFTWAFAATSAAMVSNIIGQGRKDEVQFPIRKIVKISTGVALLIAVIINIFPTQLLSVFGQDEAFIIAGIPVVRVVTTAMVFMSFSVIWLNAVTGTGNSRITFLNRTFHYPSLLHLYICCSWKNIFFLSPMDG